MSKNIFELHSEYQPAGDQPAAIASLVAGIENNESDQVLLGVTGSGKTFTIANVIAHFNRQVLVISHNKTLASQLYVELKEFFPKNKVEYFISYFDYYRPEAYIPSTDTFIDKTSLTNDQLEALRLSSLNSLLTNDDTIVVASVASIYGTFAPEKYVETFIDLRVGMVIKRRDFFLQLINRQYTRNQMDLKPGTFMAKGDVVEIAPAWHTDHYLRVDFFGDEIEGISEIDPLNKTVHKRFDHFTLYPASIYVTQADSLKRAITLIKEEFEERKRYFKERNKLLELQRLNERITRDIDDLEEFGMTKGIENYSRHLEGRTEGEKPYTIFDFLHPDALIIIDESHMMIPQLNAMYKGDRSRKITLVDYGFRLPSALDNRPLKFAEWEAYKYNKIYISATPAEYETTRSHNKITNLIVRPTGLLDPVIEVRKKENQIEDIYDELQVQIQRNERTLILTTTKRFSEELTRYFQKRKQKVAYIHSDHNTFERNEILRKLRKGVYDVVIGINLLREGIDLPEVSLIIVLDADHESFFRNKRSLIQIAGRAARNENGRVIFYADRISKSMQATIDDNLQKRALQIAYNKKHKIIPKTIVKPIPEPIQDKTAMSAVNQYFQAKSLKEKMGIDKQKTIAELRKEMLQASKKLHYERAAELRDLILELEAE